MRLLVGIGRVTTLMAFAAIPILTSCSQEEVHEGILPDPKFEELETIPVGIEVSHSPDPVKAREDGRRNQRYTWTTSTTVSAIDEPVTIVEFGAFLWFADHWTFRTYTGKPFTGEDFADWFSCPDARLQPGQSYVDPNNWIGHDLLDSGRLRWYFVGVTADGKKVKGEAIVEYLAEVE